MRTILFAAAAFTCTGVAGAAEPTRLDAAQMDWVTASTPAARVIQEARPSGGVVDDHALVEAAKRDLETLVGEGAGASAGVDAKPGGGTTVATLENSGAGTSGSGGSTIVVISGTEPGTASAYATQTIINNSDSDGGPVVTTSTGGISTGGLTGRTLTYAPTTSSDAVSTGTPVTSRTTTSAAVSALTPVTAPTTVSLGSLTPSTSLGSMSALPSLGLRSGGLGSGGLGIGG